MIARLSRFLVVNMSLSVSCAAHVKASSPALARWSLDGMSMIPYHDLEYSLTTVFIIQILILCQIPSGVRSVVFVRCSYRPIVV